MACASSETTRLASGWSLQMGTCEREVKEHQTGSQATGVGRASESIRAKLPTEQLRNRGPAVPVTRIAGHRGGSDTQAGGLPSPPCGLPGSGPAMPATQGEHPGPPSSEHIPGHYQQPPQHRAHLSGPAGQGKSCIEDCALEGTWQLGSICSWGCSSTPQSLLIMFLGPYDPQPTHSQPQPQFMVPTLSSHARTLVLSPNPPRALRHCYGQRVLTTPTQHILCTRLYPCPAPLSPFFR